jgi:hypothetical protein
MDSHARQVILSMFDWEIIADQIAKAGWSYGYNKYLTDDKDSGEVRVVYVADAHRSDGHRFVSQAETLMTAFIELQKVLRDVDLKGN